MVLMDYTPLWLSVKTAVIATVIVFIVAVFFARLMARKHFFGKNVIESIFLLPLVLPPTVVGFGLLYLLGKKGFIGQFLLATFDVQIVFTYSAVVIAAVVVSFPLMYQSAQAAFQNYDVNIENAAYTMGASPWRVFWTVSFPLAWPGLLAGTVLTFARALGEFGATLMLAGYIPNVTNTIPLAIYFEVEMGNMKMAGIWAILIAALGFVAILWLNGWSRKNIMRYKNGA